MYTLLNIRLKTTGYLLKIGINKLFTQCSDTTSKANDIRYKEGLSRHRNYVEIGLTTLRI
jgi:hypothetical protein